MANGTNPALEPQPVRDWQPRPEPDTAGLTGRRVRLEPLAVHHAQALFAGLVGDPATWEFMRYGPFATAAAYAEWVGSVAGRPDPLFLVILDSAGQPVGVASYLRIDRTNGACEVGHIALSLGLRRTAAATEAMYLMAARVFAQGYRRYEWKCDARNLASRRAAQRLGFSYEGTFRQHLVVKGLNRDTAWFAMTDGDWAKIGAAQRRWLAPDNFDPSGRQRTSLSALTAPLLAARDPALG